MSVLGKCHAIPLLTLLMIFSLFAVCFAEESSSIQVKGFVYRYDGSPIENATVRLWGFYLEAENFTDSRGRYELSATTTQTNCQLYAYYIDPDTNRYDLLPSQKSLPTGDDLKTNINFTLQHAATVYVIGQLKPMESTKKITKFAFEIVNPVDGGIKVGDYRLIYGTGMNVQSYFLDLDPLTIIVPADIPFAVEVSSSYQYERFPPDSYFSRWRHFRQRTTVETFNQFSIVEEEGFILGAGEVLRLDIRKYSLLSDRARIDALMDEVEGKLSEVEDKGFYVADERHSIKEAKESLSDTGATIEEGEYEDVYVSLRQAYLKMLSVRSRLESVIFESSFSLKVLLVFAAITSVVLGALLAEGGIFKILLTVSSFVPMVLYLRLVYPGSSVFDTGGYAFMGVTSLLGVLFLFIILPRALGSVGGREELAFPAALLAVFSIGKRSLKRRRLRSLFTFTTIMTLTMSFVALTSLSTSYGLIFNRSGAGTPDVEGIMVRMPVYTTREEFQKGAFSPVIPQTMEWAWANEGVINVAKRAENTPSLRPYARIGDWPIFGVIGIQPDVEPLMPFIDGTLVDGEPLREEDTCLLHRYMRSNAGLDVGDQIFVGGVPLRIVGFFEGLRRITDMDGETILPKYQVLVSPDPPIIEVRFCHEDAVVITTLNTALCIEKVLVSRIDLELKPGIDLETTGKSMALSREYRIWISEGGKTHIAYMGSQIGGKGFPILVPWFIVVLNVITTMLNSMFERHKEIDILSSIGLNPMHIAGVFLAEASILGVTGGSLGYITGLGLYPLMKNLALAPLVTQKISAFWLFAALGIAFASVIIGCMIALGWSVGITPSLTMRWSLRDQKIIEKEPYQIRLPVKITEESLENFICYTKSYLDRFTKIDSIPRISGVKLNEKGEEKTLSFTYDARNSSVGVTLTSNIVTVARIEGDTYSVTLASRGDRDAASTTGKFLRRIMIRWSTEHGKQNLPSIA